MKRHRRTEAQIERILTEADQGESTRKICERYGISEQTFYRWRRQYSAQEPQPRRRLKVLEDENAKLKRLLAEKELSIHNLTVALQKVTRSRARR